MLSLPLRSATKRSKFFKSVVVTQWKLSRTEGVAMGYIERQISDFVHGKYNHAEVPVVPAGGEDSQYLACHLGDVLKHALAEVSEKRPWDPIEYLAQWLYRYSDNTKREQQEAVEKMQLRLEEEEEALRQQRELKMEYEKRFILNEEERRKEGFLKRAREVEELEKKQLEESEKMASAAPPPNSSEPQSADDTSHDGSSLETTTNEQNPVTTDISYPADDSVPIEKASDGAPNLYTISEKEPSDLSDMDIIASKADGDTSNLVSS